MARASIRGQAILIPPIQQEDITIGDTVDFSKGWLGDIALRKIPPNGFKTLTNFVFLRGRLLVQNGLTPFTVTKPDSNKVLNIYGFFEVSTGLNLLRFTRNKIYKIQSDGFVEFTPDAIAAMSGSDLNYFSFASADNRFFFSNDGIDPIRELDPVAQTYKAFGNAPRYRFITSAFDRVIGANLVAATDIPYQYGFSGAFNYDEWDQTVDISAGEGQLVTSPSDTSDDITGLFSFNTFLVIPREKSIWIGQHQNSASQPFYFYARFPNLGMDEPRTIQKTEKGLIWYNRQLGQVIYWEPPDGVPEKKNLQIKVSIKNLLSTGDYEYFASYNPDTYIYSLFASQPATKTLEFQYSFIEDNWVVIEHNNPNIVSAVYDLSSGFSSTTIDELSGTIDDLEGIIDQLGGVTASSTRLLGTVDGEFEFVYPFSGDVDNEPTAVAPNELAILETGLYEQPVTDSNFSLFRVEYIPYTEGVVTLTFYKQSKNGNVAAKTKSVTISSNDLNKNLSIQIKKSLKAKSGYIQLTSTALIQPTRITVLANKLGISKTGAP